jgi:hypothetical protein
MKRAALIPLSLLVFSLVNCAGRRQASVPAVPDAEPAAESSSPVHVETAGPAADGESWALGEIPRKDREDDETKRIMGNVPGEWVFTDTAKSVEYPIVDAVTLTIFKFGDLEGRSVYIEEKKTGYSTGFLHEDWEFRSYGTYGFRGDTIFFRIGRFAAVRQHFKRRLLHRNDGEEVWKDEPAPVFDSLVTDGSQDRFFLYADIIEDFKKRQDDGVANRQKQE